LVDRAAPDLAGLTDLIVAVVYVLPLPESENEYASTDCARELPASLSLVFDVSRVLVDTRGESFGGGTGGVIGYDASISHSSISSHPFCSCTSLRHRTMRSAAFQSSIRFRLLLRSRSAAARSRCARRSARTAAYASSGSQSPFTRARYCPTACEISVTRLWTLVDSVLSGVSVGVGRVTGRESRRRGGVYRGDAAVSVLRVRDRLRPDGELDSRFASAIEVCV